MITLYHKIKTRALQYISWYARLEKQGFNGFIGRGELRQISMRFSYNQACFFDNSFPKGTTVGKLIKKIYEGENKYNYSSFAVTLYQVFKLSGVTKSYYTKERYMFQENIFENGVIKQQKNYNKDGKLVMMINDKVATWYDKTV